jgi:F-type H+-transporting ATPase subunit b
MHIDWWTLALQTVNVLVLIWILGRFFFRPVADIVAKRQEETSRLLADAAHARKEAIDLRAEADKARGNVAAERERLVAEAQKAAEGEKARLLAKSADEIAKQRAEAESAIARERATTEQAIISHASELSIEITQRLLKRLPVGVSFPAFLEGICGELRNLSSEAQYSFAAADADHPIAVVTAAVLTDEQAAQVRKSLHGVFGTELSLTFRSDPALIAGIELHSRNTIVRNNWQADLGRIREELNRDGHHGPS